MVKKETNTKNPTTKEQIKTILEWLEFYVEDRNQLIQRIQELENSFEIVLNQANENFSNINKRFRLLENPNQVYTYSWEMEY